MRTKSLILAIVTMLTLAVTAQDEATYYGSFRQIFKDNACTELLPAYAAMTDEQMLTALDGLPQSFIDLAMKIKNNTWSEYEKEFRIAEYSPYSDPYYWASYMRTNPYSKLNNPTGITCKKDDVLLVFVEEQVYHPATLTLAEVEGSSALPAVEHYLYKGLNVITTRTNGTLFVNYNAETGLGDGAKLSDYKDIKIQIAGGTLNGYFDYSRHTNEDWVKMRKSIMKNEIVDIKGEKVLFHMHLNKVAAVCPTDICSTIDGWDTIVKWQHQLMGADSEKYNGRWNNLMMCCDGEGSYMYATYHYTYYEYNTLPDILPWAKVKANPGYVWGPAHEIGHMNQGAINIISCTEVSNNLFSNMVVQRMGTTTTRGQKIDQCIKDFNDKVPFPLRSEVFSKTRMYWQLYLYFHEAGHDNTFYPRLFEYLRENPISGTSGVNGKFNQLRFAEACCEIAQMDLSEFFEAWGFFVPMSGAYVSDYNNYYVTLTPEDAEESRKKMQKYEKKGGHLMFIEDRVKPSKRTDGVNGNRLDWNSEVPVGSAGDVGQWEDYIDHSVKAKGYVYYTSGNTVTILCNENSAGAVGFKVYDKNDNLIAFSNRYRITIPANTDTKSIRIVAAQANGDNATIPTAAESGTEEQQLTALNSCIASANSLFAYTTTGNAMVGYYISSALETLKKMLEEATSAAENKDQSLHTYSEWITLIEEEVERLGKDSEAMVMIKEKNHYTAAHRQGALAVHNNTLKAASASQVPSSSDYRRWEFVLAADGEGFYMKNVGFDKYISEISNGRAAAITAASTDDAIKFMINYNGNGTLTFISSENSDVALGVNNDKNIVGINTTSTDAQWKVRMVADNSTSIEIVEEENQDRESSIYDLSGRKIEKITDKGIYIVNGKKMLVK